MVRPIILLLAIGAALIVFAAQELCGQSYINTVNYQGRLVDSTGAPVEPGDYSVVFRIYDDTSRGDLLWEEARTVTVGEGGLFSLYLGEENGLDLSVFRDTTDGFNTPPRWLEIEVGGETMDRRTRLACVPCAHVAGRLAGDVFTHRDKGEDYDWYYISTEADTGSSGDTLVKVLWEGGKPPASKNRGAHMGSYLIIVTDHSSGDTLSSLTARATADYSSLRLCNDDYSVMMESGASNVGLTIEAPAADTSFWIRHVDLPSDQQVYTKGRVGVGTTNPQGKLAVEGNSTNAAVVGRNTGTGAGVKGTNAGTGPALLGTADSGDLLQLFSTASGDPRLVVDNDGNLCLVGTVTEEGGCDLAENMTVLGNPDDYAPGDVLVLSEVNLGQLELTDQPYCRRVAGVYSAAPGYHLGRNAFGHEKNQVPVALSGIVPVKVCAENGTIQVGDLLVSSSRPGYAMKGTDAALSFGAVIGKAVEPLDGHEGMIRVLISVR